MRRLVAALPFAFAPYSRVLNPYSPMSNNTQPSPPYHHRPTVSSRIIVQRYITSLFDNFFTAQRQAVIVVSSVAAVYDRRSFNPSASPLLPRRGAVGLSPISHFPLTIAVSATYSAAASLDL
jgi:hypothetical protein